MKRTAVIGVFMLMLWGCGPSAEDRQKAAEDAQRLEQELMEEMDAMETQMDSVLEAEDGAVTNQDTF